MQQINLDVAKNEVPFIRNWVGAWAMHEPHFHATRQQLESMSISLHLSNGSNREEALSRVEEQRVTVQEGIAIVNVEGTLMKHASSFSESSSTVVLRQTLRSLSNDPNVKGIALRIDSPGGTVAGTNELASEINKVRQSKPVWAYCNDLTASAAYWIASQCDHIEANETSLVGSIGTYCVVMDSSAAAAKAGFVVHVVRAGEFKGSGTPGTEITAEQLDQINAQVIGLNAFFLKAVEKGRSMSTEKVKELADGRVHIANEAQSLGLIDGVATFEDFFDRFASQLHGSSPNSSVASSHEREKFMSSENSATNSVAVAVAVASAAPATIGQIKSEFPKANADWVLACVEKNLTLEQCRSSYCNILQAQLEASEKRAAEAEERAKLTGKKPGHAALKSSSKSKAMDEEKDPESMDDYEDEDDMEEDPVALKARWSRLVDKEMAVTRGDRMKASQRVNKKHPGLRQAMVEAENRNRRLIAR